MNGNLSADPLFCNPDLADFRLQDDSPCAPGGECGLIGAWPVGCGPSTVGESEAASIDPAIWSTPNPLVGGTTIAYRLGHRGLRRASHCRSTTSRGGWSGRSGASGSRARQVASGGMGPTTRAVQLPGGVYLLRLTVGSQTVTERVIKIR